MVHTLYIPLLGEGRGGGGGSNSPSPNGTSPPLTQDDRHVQCGVQGHVCRSEI
jgi:hypothetical protein